MTNTVEIRVTSSDHTNLGGIRRHVKEEFGKAGAEASKEFDRSFAQDGSGGGGRGRRLLAGSMTAGLSEALKPLGNLIGPLKAKFGELGSTVLKFGTIAGAAAQAVLVLAPAVIKLGQAVVSVGQAALQAAPALLAIGAAGLFIKATLSAIAPTLGKAFRSVGQALEHAGKEASNLAVRGIRPLAQEFAKLDVPIISRAMDKIARTVNHIVKGFMEWATSTKGLHALKEITGSAATAFGKLGPHITKLAIAFFEMLGRISAVSDAAGARGLAGALDKLTEKLKHITAGSVSSGLHKLAHAFHVVKDAVSTAMEWVHRGVDFWRAHRREISLVADALGVLAIAFGGPITAIAALVGMVVRHFDKIKAAWKSVKAYFASSDGAGFLDHLKHAAQTVWPPIKKAFDQIKHAVMPVLKEIGDKILHKLVPAFGEFLDAAAPVVAWFVSVMGPYVAKTFKNLLKVISGAIDVITGIFQVFTGILTGDWHKAWDGVKNIARGAWKILSAIFHQGVNIIGTAFHLLIGVLKKIMTKAVNFGWVKEHVRGFFSGAGGWLKDAGHAIINGLVSGIESATVGPLKSALGHVTSMIPEWKGPRSKDLKLLRQTGHLIMQGLIDGIEGQVATIRQKLGEVTSAIRRSFHGHHEDVLVAWVRSNTNKLLDLAHKRDAVIKRIADARKYAAGIAGNTSGFAGLTSLGETANADQIRGALTTKLTQLTQFAQGIKELSRRGLSKGMIGQLAEAGPESGLPLVMQLLGGSGGTLKQINKLQAGIGRAAGSVGNAAADALFDSGRGAARGFLTGLKQHEHELQAQMDRLAERFAHKLRDVFRHPQTAAHQGHGHGRHGHHKGHHGSAPTSFLDGMFGAGATGGIRGGLTLVGEQGRELVRLPYGSSVVPHGQTEQMLGGGSGGGGGRVVIELRSGGSRLDDLLVQVFRTAIRDRGGNVQTVLGS